MDVSLVLTHRCNFACGYCYAGAHLQKDMGVATMERGVALLFADGASEAQLSFFGGEPFLAAERMQQAIAAAQAEAERRGARLTLQCTTNGSLLGRDSLRLVADSGMKLVISIDGVREAHEAQRPLAGGCSSYNAVISGLRAAVEAGVQPEAMMVVTPETAPQLLVSVCALWDEGVPVVRANLELSQLWTDADRRALREELVAVGREQLRRHLAGQEVLFQPFEVGMRAQRRTAARLLAGQPDPPTGCAQAHDGSKRAQVVVATTGHLYPCGPMVGEDRDDGPEATLRLGHLDAGVASIVAAVAERGAGCGDGEGCACAAYLETGDRLTGGPNGLWFARVCEQIGRATAAGIDVAMVRQALSEPRSADPRRGRGLLYLGAGLGVASLAGGAWMAGRAIFAPTPMAPGAMAMPPSLPPVKAAGGVRAPTKLPPQPSILGEMAPPPIKGPDGKRVVPPKKVEPRRRTLVKGDVAAPPIPPKVRGQLARPPATAKSGGKGPR
jgi:uncharacterized protein